MTRARPIPETVTLHVPFRIVKRGGRKEMHLPDGAAAPRGLLLKSSQFDRAFPMFNRVSKL